MSNTYLYGQGQPIFEMNFPEMKDFLSFDMSGPFALSFMFYD